MSTEHKHHNNCDEHTLALCLFCGSSEAHTVLEAHCYVECNACNARGPRIAQIWPAIRP